MASDSGNSSTARLFFACPLLWQAAIGGGLATGAACLAAPAPWPLFVLALLVSLNLGVTLSAEYRRAKWQDTLADSFHHLRLPLQLAQSEGFGKIHAAWTEALSRLAAHGNSSFSEFARLRLETLARELSEIAQGRLTFMATETWRSVYETLLTTLDVKVYYSVAWVQDLDYWNDQPGRQSMQLNYALIERGFRIERVFILPDSLWPYEDPLPRADIRPWIDEQLQRGIVVSLAREHELKSEPDLLADFGVYGKTATGHLELDDQALTQRFTFDFDPQAVQAALDRWRRLSIYAASYEKLLDSEA